MHLALAALNLMNMMNSIKWTQSQQTHTTPNNSITHINGVTRVVIHEEYKLGDRVSCPVCHGEAYITGKTVHSTGDCFFTVSCLDCGQNAIAHKYP